MKMLVLRQPLGSDPQPECDALHHVPLFLLNAAAVRLFGDDGPPLQPPLKTALSTMEQELRRQKEDRTQKEPPTACTRKPWHSTCRWRREPSRGYGRLRDSRGHDRDRCWGRPRECRARAASYPSRALLLRGPSSGRGQCLDVAMMDAPAAWRPRRG